MDFLELKLKKIYINKTIFIDFSRIVNSNFTHKNIYIGESGSRPAL